MAALNWRRGGLRLQLTLFYVALSIPALLLLEQSIMAFEFQRCVRQLDDGRVQLVLEREALQFEAALARGIDAPEVEQRLRRFVLELERPRESLGTKAAYVLLELTPHPFTASLKPTELADQAQAQEAGMIMRRWTAPLADRREWLVLDLAVPSPWRHLADRLSFEWPIAVAYLVVFVLGSAWFMRRRVLARISRIGAAAQSWARGDFAPHLADQSSDELGELAQDLNRMAADLKALFATRSTLATLEERRRLARDLHDTVKQKVFALSLQVAAARQSGADPERLQQRLSEADALVEEIQRELADLLRELREDAGAAEDLIPALQRRLADFSRRSGLQVSTELPQTLNLAPTHAEAVLRIADEALANAWRHSAASAIQVSLRREAQRVCLQIADNGRGGARESRLGMGLTNMRQRAATLPMGEFVVNSPDDAGTEVSLIFELGE